MDTVVPAIKARIRTHDRAISPATAIKPGEDPHCSSSTSQATPTPSDIGHGMQLLASEVDVSVEGQLERDQSIAVRSPSSNAFHVAVLPHVLGECLHRASRSDAGGPRRAGATGAAAPHLGGGRRGDRLPRGYRLPSISGSLRYTTSSGHVTDRAPLRRRRRSGTPPQPCLIAELRCAFVSSARRA